jgi:CRP-like cAMP-binding protein
MKTVFKATGGKKDPVKDQTVTFSAGESIYRQGDLGSEMFIILEGEVQITKTLRGEPMVLSRLEKGDFFGEMAVIESAARNADAIAHTDTRLLPINGARFDEMLRKNPEIALRMIRKYALRLQEANDLLEKLAVSRVEPDNSLGRLEAAPDAEIPEQPVAEPPAVRQPRLVDVATGRTFSFGKGTETTIGRTDPVTGILPDIDLTPVDIDRSVSRRHAKILSRDGHYSILEEVGTINGTFVNEQRIPTGQPIPLRNGDRLRVGLINMKVAFD